MTDPVSVVLIFSGLIAFVPNLKGNDPQAITALLLNGGHEYEHHQVLRVPMGTLQGFCPRAHCSTKTLPTGEGKNRTATYCECPLRGAKVSLEPVLQQKMDPLPAKPEGILPDLDNANSIAWIVRLKNLDSGFSELDREKFKKFDGSQITFQSMQAATCAFDEDLDQVSRTVFNDRFIQQGKVVHEQAIAEMAVFVVAVGKDRTVVKVTVDSQSDFTLTLGCPAPLSCPIILLNTPPPPSKGKCVACSDCVYGDHFAEYWKLTGRSFGGGAVPRRECGTKSELPTHKSYALCPDYQAVARELVRQKAPSPEVSLSLAPEWVEAEEEGVFLAPTRKALNSTLIEGRTIGSRVICPMAVIEP